MPLQDISSPHLKVAIIGGGPAGLGAAIEFSKLPYVDWKLYEQASAIREIGAGISIQRSTWRMLEVMGAAKNLTDIFRPVDGHHTQHRSALLYQIWDQVLIRPEMVERENWSCQLTMTVRQN